MLAKIIVTIAFYLFYWFCCFLGTCSDKKNLAGLRSYPDDVQQAVRKHPVLGKAAPQEKSVLSILIGNLLLFTVVFSVLGFALKNILGLDNFGTAFRFFLVLGEGFGLFDLIVIDLLWWRNTKRIRFSFLPEKQCYQDPSKQAYRLVPSWNSNVCGGGSLGCRSSDDGRMKQLSVLLPHLKFSLVIPAQNSLKSV